MHALRLVWLVTAGITAAWPRPAQAHLVNGNVGEFYAGMLHPVTSAEHILPMLVLALLAGQCGKQAGRRVIVLFPLALMAGLAAGSRLPAAAAFHVANLAAIGIMGLMLMHAHRLKSWVPDVTAVFTGLILGWRSGMDWAASDLSWRFVPGAALTGLIVAAVIAAWVPPSPGRNWKMVRSVAGCGFFITGAAMLAHLLIIGSQTAGGSIGLPTEENLKALVSAPQLSLNFILGAFFAAMAWGAAHALTPGHGKAIVGAYLVGSRGTAWHAVYLGLTVTVTHTLGVFMLGLAATLAAGWFNPEIIYPWLGVLSGFIVLMLGAGMLISRLRRLKPFYAAHVHHHHGPHHDHGHHHVHDHDHGHHHHLHDLVTEHASCGDPEQGHHHRHDENAHPDAFHQGHTHQHLGGHAHSHLPLGMDGSKVTWRSLLTLGVSGGLLPCPSAMVLLLSAVAMHRIGFGLVLVTAFSIGLAGVLTVVGLLFIKGSRLIDQSPSFALLGRWLPTASALVVCVIGGGITWRAAASLLGG